MIGTPEKFLLKEELEDCGLNRGRIAARFLLKKTIIEEILEIRNMEYYKKLKIIKNRKGKPKYLLGKELKDIFIRKKIRIEDLSITHIKNRVAIMIVYSKALFSNNLKNHREKYD